MLYNSIEGYFVDFAKLIVEYMTKVCNLSQNYRLPYLYLLTHIFNAFRISLEGKECLNSQIPIINENILNNLKFKLLLYGCWKHEEEISTKDIGTLTPQSYHEEIPPPQTEWFKDLKEIKRELPSRKIDQGENKQTLVDLQGMCEDLGQFATELTTLSQI